MDASEIYSTRLNAKEVIFPKEKGELVFTIADGRIKLLGRDQDLRTSTLIRERPIRGESHVDFLGDSEGSFPPPPHDSLPDACEAINVFWSKSGNFMYRHHVEPRVKLDSPREESFPIPQKYIDVSRTTHTNLDVMQESRVDDFWSRDLSDSWTGFTQWIYMVRVETDKNGKRHPGQIIYGHNSGRNWEEMPSWRRGKSGHMKSQNSIMHENYEEFISLSGRTRNSKRPSRMLAGNWKHQRLPLCLARQARTISMRWLVENPMRLNQHLRVFWNLVKECA